MPNDLRELLAEFEHANPVGDATYKEDWARADYIEPLFNALGWTRINPMLLTTASTGFVREVALRHEGSAKAPDYGFYVNGRRTFYVEAKKPAINIKADLKPALQIRDYGWSATDDVGIITDFEELAVYNCRLQPQAGDAPSVGLVDYMTFREYESRWDWLVEHLSPTAVTSGSLRRLVEDYKDKKRLVPVGPAFLADVEAWRVRLAQAILRRNTVAHEDLGVVAQTLIDRIVFLRIAEARGLEPVGALRSVLNQAPMYPALFKLFELADARYNAGLFHFRKEAHRDEPDTLSSTLKVDDEDLRSIIGRLTDPESPYRFEVIPADILGQVYERFLGNELEVDGDRVLLKPKPEYRKSGGVFYTPTEIVEYIVDRTLGPILQGKSIAAARLIRIVDPACGSGSFLISAYQYLIDWYTQQYSRFKRRSDREKVLMQGSDGKLRLRTEERKRILVENIFGVDIDRQAVEVAKLSLLLKLIEGETQLALQVDRLLPDIDGNIVCGNSLVGTDFYSTNELVSLTPEEARIVNAFDWSSAFGHVAAAGGFDVVVGNPPWLMAGYYVAESMEYFHRQYKTATGKADLYYLFLEKALRLVRPGGRVGMIVPSKLFHTQAAKALRGLLSGGGWVEEIVDFGTQKLFEGATNYSCILTMSEGNVSPISVLRPQNLFSGGRRFSVARGDLTSANWHLLEPDRRELWRRLEQTYPTLESRVDGFGNGVQSGADGVLIMSSSKREDLGIEEELCRSILKGKDVRDFQADPSSVLLFPYKDVQGSFQLLTEAELRTEYPQGHAYLVENRRKLNARRWFMKSATQLSGQWFGMMYLDDLSAFDGEKIVTPSLAARSNFALDDGHLFVTGTAGVTSVRVGSPELRRYLVGLLNSTLLSAYITDHSSPYQGGYFKFSAPYIRRVPIHVPDLTLRTGQRAFEQVAEIAKSLCAPRKGRAMNATALLSRLDDLVFALYDVNADEKATLR